MFYLNSLSNSFVLGEKKADGTIIKQFGFPKGGLTYLIENNNIKFYLKEDYFYKNLVFSADAPLLIDGVLVPINSIPAALTKIFHMEAEGSVVDTEFNTESFNAIANSPVSIKFNEIEALQGTISGEVDTLSGAMETKADRSEIPDVSNFIEMSDVETYTYDKQTIDTKIENVEVDAYTKTESDARFQPIGDYLTKASGDTIYQPIGDYATRSEIPSVVGYADSVRYNSTTKYVEFYHGGTGGTKVFEYDAAPFLIDGMVQNVEIVNGNLVISFNTDAGKQDITIPLTDIFDPSNYYDKTAIDGLLANKVNTSAFNTYSAATDARIAEDEEVTAAALNNLDEKIGDPYQKVSGLTIDTDEEGDFPFIRIEKELEDGNSDYTFINDGGLESTYENNSDGSNYSSYIGQGTISNSAVDFPDENVISERNINISTDGFEQTTYENYEDGESQYTMYSSENRFEYSEGLRMSQQWYDEKFDTTTNSNINIINNRDGDTYIELTDHNERTVTIAPNALTWDDGRDNGYIEWSNIATLDDIPTIPTVPTNVSDFTNDAGYITSGDAASQIEEAVSGKVNTSTYNTYTAATNSRISEDEEVTAAALNALNDKFGGLSLVKLTQAEYDALVTKNPNVLYIIVD